MFESGLRTKRCKLKSLKGGFFCVWNSSHTKFLVLLINAVNLEQAVLAACELTTEYIDKIDSVYIFGLKYIMLSIGCIVFFSEGW